MSRRILKYIIVLELSLIFCCSHAFFPFSKELVEPTGQVDKEVRKQVNHFKRTTGVEALYNNIHVIPVPEKHDWAARCFWAYDTIIVDKNAWEQLNKLQKRWLIYHELGHCRFMFQHIEPEEKSWYKRKKFFLMNPTIPPSLFLNKRRWNIMLTIFLKRI
jgi:hypothetical protein